MMAAPRVAVTRRRDGWRRTLRDRARDGRPDDDDQLGAEGTPPLEPDEELLAVLRGIGSVMFLTSRRIILARDGSDRRPRTGIQSFPLETVQFVRLERGSGPSARVVIAGAGGQEAVSMFVESRSLDRADAFVATSRLLAARRRRAETARTDRLDDPSES